MPKDPRTLRSLRSGAIMPDQSSRASALAGIVAIQARHNAGGSISFPDHASRLRYMQGVIHAQQRRTLEPPAPTAPDAPTGVAATRGNQQISVSFAAPADNGGSPILDYTVISSPEDIAATASSSPIIVVGLTNGTAYTFRVKARNAIGPSPLSAPSAAVIPATEPDAPTNVSGASGDSKLTVSFTPPVDNGGSLILDYTATAYDGATAASSQITTSSPVELTGLTNGTSYTVKVKARNEIGFSEEAAAPATITPATIPQPPSIQSATSGDSSVSISFISGNDGGSPITNYQYSTDGGVSFIALQPADISSPIIITGLTNGVQYIVSLKAVNAVGPSAESDSVIVMPVSPIRAPDTPTNLVADTVGISSAVISFTEPADGGSAITNYQYSTNNGATFTAFSPADISSPITITDLAASTSYQIKLKAVNAIGASVASTALSITTNAGPTAPTLTYALPDNGAVYIYFNAGTNGGSTITNYEYSLDEAAFIALSPADTSSPIKISGLTNGVLYTIRLRSVTGVGNSDASNVLSVTPTSAISRTAPLIYDLCGGASYSGTGTTVVNVGSAGTVSGTMNGSITYNANIKGGILDFNGGRISFPQTNFGSVFTVSAWVYPTSKNSINGLITNAGANQAPKGFKLGWNSWTSTDRRMLYEGGNGTTGNARVSTIPEIVHDTWQHLTYILDTSAVSVLFFRNGLPVDITNTSTVAGVGTNQAFSIGAFTDGSYSMGAQLSSIKIYTGIAFTAADVQAEFDATKARFLTPDAPTNLAQTSSTTTSITVSFTPGSDNGSSITNYEYSLNNGSSYTPFNPAITSSPGVIPGLVGGTIYAVRIRAVNAYGAGSASSVINGVASIGSI